MSQLCAIDITMLERAITHKHSRMPGKCRKGHRKRNFMHKLTAAIDRVARPRTIHRLQKRYAETKQ